MSNPFFNQFKDTVWVPPNLPALFDTDWINSFKAGSLQEQKNLANGWLWVLNLNMRHMDDEDDVKDQISLVVDDNYEWLRLALPCATSQLFKNERFDGSLQRLFELTSKTAIQFKPLFTEALHKMWFGQGNERLDGLSSMAPLIRVRVDNYQDLPKLRHLVQKLAWDIALENPTNVDARKHAANISVTYGLTEVTPAKHRAAECMAWHSISRLSGGVNTNPRLAYGCDTLAVLRSENPAVAAANLPRIMHRQRNDTGKSNPYKNRLGLVYNINKELEKITDYDVLREWIPARTSMWDAFETLDIPYTEACAQVANEINVKVETIIALPPELNLDT